MLSELCHKRFSFTMDEVSLSSLSLTSWALSWPGLAVMLWWPPPNHKDGFYATTSSSTVWELRSPIARASTSTSLDNFLHLQVKCLHSLYFTSRFRLVFPVKLLQVDKDPIFLSGRQVWCHESPASPNAAWGRQVFELLCAGFAILNHPLPPPPPVKTFVFNPSHEFCNCLVSFDVCKYFFTTSLSILCKLFFKLFPSPHFLPLCGLQCFTAFCSLYFGLDKFCPLIIKGIALDRDRTRACHKWLSKDKCL